MAVAVLLAWLALILLAILWLPALGTGLHLRNLGAARPLAELRWICPLQLAVAVGAVGLVYRLDPPGRTAWAFAAIVAASVAGAVLLWWRRRPVA